MFTSFSELKDKPIIQREQLIIFFEKKRYTQYIKICESLQKGRNEENKHVAFMKSMLSNNNYRAIA
jgi:hypothetical protein